MATKKSSSRRGKRKGVLYLRVINMADRGIGWAVGLSRALEGFSLDDRPHNKAEAMRLADKYARDNKPSVVKVYDKNGRLQNHYQYSATGEQTILRGGDVA